MKKLVLFLAVALVAATAFAFDFAFTPVSLGSLYPESQYDPYGFGNELGVFYIPSVEERSIEFLVYHDDGTGNALATTPVSRWAVGCPTMSFYLTGKLHADISFFTSTFDFGDAFPTVTVDLNLKAGLGIVIEGTESNKVLSHDGSYFFGPEVSVDCGSTLRIGLGHLSGHYGDEVLDWFETYNHVQMLEEYGDATIRIDGVDYPYYGLAQYVRDNNFMLGVSQQLPWGFSVYAELAQPFHNSYVRPFFECPGDHDTGTYTEDKTSVWEALASGEGILVFPTNPAYRVQALELLGHFSSKYKATRIHCGANWEMEFGSVGLCAGVDFQAHQDGQTLHRLDGYNSHNSWEYEVTAGIGASYGNLGLDIKYHDGRFPSLNLFNNRVRYVSLTFSVK